jgi:sulfatase maturation enzyme AslB (radical SAM superfamily)
MNNNLLDMISYSTLINPNIEIRIHTNGSLRNKAWWKKLAQSLPKKHAVIFAIDGLEDTHSIYRIGTDFNKIIDNAREFILNGGIAEWAYLRFKHNEHQVDQAKQLASSIGFKTFVMKDSSRFLIEPKFPVVDAQGQTTYNLQPSQFSEIKFIDRKVIENYKQVVKSAEIDCHALNTKEIYITAQGLVFPCCWLGMTPYLPIDHETDLVSIRKEILKQYYELVDRLGGEAALNAELHSIKDIIDSEAYQSVWTEYWTTNKLITCARSCGKLPEVFSTPNQQFISFDKLS